MLFNQPQPPRRAKRPTNMHSKFGNKFQSRFAHFELVWHNVILFAIIHAAAVYGLYLKFHAVHLATRLFSIIYGHFSALGVTAGRHRYFSHRAFKGRNRCLDVLLMLFACTAFEQSIYTWCRDHRLHHKNSETDADPYNSNRGFFFSHVGWFFVRKHKEVKEKGKLIDMSDLRANPVVMFEHKYCYQLALIFTFLVPTLLPWYFFNESLAVTFFYCTLYRYVVVLHATWSVNSFAHLYGMRSYDKNIQPVENHWVSTAALGEGFHNYHHTFPWDYKAAELGGDCRNMTTCFIDFLATVGIVTERKTAPQSMIDRRKERTGDPTWHAAANNIRSTILHIVYAVVVV